MQRAGIVEAPLWPGRTVRIAAQVLLNLRGSGKANFVTKQEGRMGRHQFLPSLKERKKQVALEQQEGEDVSRAHGSSKLGLLRWSMAADA